MPSIFKDYQLCIFTYMPYQYIKIQTCQYDFGMHKIYVSIAILDIQLIVSKYLCNLYANSIGKTRSCSPHMMSGDCAKHKKSAANTISIQIGYWNTSKRGQTSVILGRLDSFRSLCSAWINSIFSWWYSVHISCRGTAQVSSEPFNGYLVSTLIKFIIKHWDHYSNQY